MTVVLLPTIVNPISAKGGGKGKNGGSSQDKAADTQSNLPSTPMRLNSQSPEGGDASNAGVSTTGTLVVRTFDTPDPSSTSQPEAVMLPDTMTTESRYNDYKIWVYTEPHPPEPGVISVQVQPDTGYLIWINPQTWGPYTGSLPVSGDCEQGNNYATTIYVPPVPGGQTRYCNLYFDETLVPADEVRSQRDINLDPPSEGSVVTSNQPQLPPPKIICADDSTPDANGLCTESSVPQ